MKRMAAIALFALFIVTPAIAGPMPKYNADGTLMTSAEPALTGKHGVRSRRCPYDLGCGCNLATYFHITGKRWRELWVARAWAMVGTAASKGCVGCVAVLTRGRRGGHVGVVKEYDASGNPVIYSYANGRLGWTTAAYSKHRVIAYRNL